MSHWHVALAPVAADISTLKVALDFSPTKAC